MEENIINKIINWQGLYCEDLQTLKDFSILRSIFEFKLFKTRYNPDKIEKELENIVVWRDKLKYFYEYLKNRYSGENNKLFETFYFEKTKDKDFIRKIIIDSDFNNVSDKNLILALFIVVNRFRNNFFHWLKAEDNFKNQSDNFKYANIFLVDLINSKK